MSDSGFSISVVRSDADLLEIEAVVRFDAWSGCERAYVTRDELTGFATALDRVVEGATFARLDAGQDDLGYARLEVFEHGGARRIGLRLVVGHAPDPDGGRPGQGRELRLSVPTERAALASFSSELRAITLAERGIAYLHVSPGWSL